MPGPFFLGRYGTRPDKPTSWNEPRRGSGCQRRHLIAVDLCALSNRSSTQRVYHSAQAPHGQSTRSHANEPHVLDPAAQCSTIFLDDKLYE